jgi:hypothetical protein
MAEVFRFAHAADVPAHIELAFDRGIPVAVNGIAMSLVELSESITTIAADHGIDAAPGVAVVTDALADLVLGQAREALEALSPEPASGVVRMKLHDGQHTILSVSSSVLAHS